MGVDSTPAAEACGIHFGLRSALPIAELANQLICGAPVVDGVSLRVLNDNSSVVSA